VLLFNEADSLFGKRTSDVKSSNDRYANLETNYLLQRLERFNGLAILTTNLTSAIDQAFKRRFTYDVFFSFPSPDMRAELWRRTLPQPMRSLTIDFDALADRYELSGGFIKVACERAAYVAGAAGSSIDEPLLRATIERMYRERGKVSAAGRLE
jgi:SpoVK/Ycf46/Vps4 family AAA+-type ATPase